MSRMHKKRKDRKNTYEMQRALTEMLSAVFGIPTSSVSVIGGG